MYRISKEKQFYKILITLAFILYFLLPIKTFAEGGSNNPQVTITASKTIDEGDSGTKNLKLTISISECPSLMPVKIKYNTSNGSADSGSDYIAKSGNITFDTHSMFIFECQKSYDITIKVKGDTNPEADENFYVQLSNNGTNSLQKFHWGNQRSTITIVNDDESQDADLAISKQNNKNSNVNIGDIVTYTIIGKNNGPKSSKIFIWDTIPDGMEFISVSDNSSNFDCSYNSSDKKVRCRGNRVFNKNDSVNITVKAKVINNNHSTIRNYAGIQSDDSPKKNDNNTNNNRDSSDIHTNKVDLRTDKKVRKKNGQYVKRANFHLGDTVKFRIIFGNYNAQPSGIHFEDTLPNGLNLVSINTPSLPSNFNCQTNNNKVTCDGSHMFGMNETVTIYINAKITKKGRIYNYAKVTSPQGYKESNTRNNQGRADLNVDLNGEKITGSKTVSAPQNGEYYIGDIVTFSIRGKNLGSTEQVRIRDWLGGRNGTTVGAFEFVSVSSDNDTDMKCTTRGSGSGFEVDCRSRNKIPNNQEFGIKIKAKLKKSGHVCNRAHFYKHLTNWLWRSYAQVCFDVSEPKSPPVLNADHFYLYLNVEDSIDLKDYTTDADTSKDQLIYQLISPLPDGLSMTQDGTISGKYTDSSGTFPKDFNVTVKVTDPDGLSDTDSFIITIKATDIVANDNYYEIPINATLNGNLITDSNPSGTHPFSADEGEGLTLTKLEPNSNITFNSSGSFTFHAPSSAKNIQYVYHIKDKYGQEDYALLKIKVFKPQIKANDDILQVAKNTPVYLNVFSDNGNGIDVGDGLKVTNFTSAQHGVLTINDSGDLTYTPNNNYVGNDKATYSIKDKYGQTDHATIYFKIGTIHEENYVDFYLVNPPATRNLIGNYITIGNTVECVTDKRGTAEESNSYNGTCQTNKDINNNDYMVKYIDVDTNSRYGAKTWNSSSATFTLPKSYLELDKGKGIAWAGLFWQGSINNRAGFKQRRASVDYGTPYGYKNITFNEPISLSSTKADKVLLNIDNIDNGYIEVTADTFYNDLSHGNFGGYYAAYANITSLLQNAQLSAKEHTITIANIVTNEGREPNVGNYGGWSLVIIYKENITGRPRNISIYNGYQPIGKGGNTNVPLKEVEISGFKLPKSGVVESKIGAFVGEGEEKYGGSSTVYDKMYIKDTNTNDTYDMPSNNPSNIFDASIENIVRKTGNYNDISNTNGIDVDNYDVSTIMQKIRDKKQDTNNIKIGIVSQDTDLSDGDQSDYVTASMIAFSTELYAPKVCYDYDIKLGEYIDIASNDRNFTVSSFENEPLQLKIMLRSQEADFDLIESKLSAVFDPSDVFKYIKDSAKYSPPNTHVYLKALQTDISKGEIAIGNNPTNSGGTLGAKETTYAKLYYDFLKPDFKDGIFDIIVDAKISFDGFNKVPYKLSTKAPKKSIFYIKRCETNPTYSPVYGMLNIERGDSKFSQDEATRYSLYTQVVGVPYEISIASYKKNTNNEYKEENPFTDNIELELIDASSFDNNSSSGFDATCSDPDTATSKGLFVKFNNQSRVKIKIPDDFKVNNKITYPENLALKNAAFRVWVLIKRVGDKNLVVNNNCNNQNDSSCFDNIYNNNYKLDDNQSFCSNECTNSSGSTCYDCLKKYYALPICSRDNFAIRPESYNIEIKDNNQTLSNLSKFIGNNSPSSNINLSAGYLYKLDINATKYNSTHKADGYFLNVTGNEHFKTAINLFNDNSACADTSDKELNIHILNGKTVGYESLSKNPNTPQNGLIVNNSGKYKIHLEDLEWTMVDQKGYAYKPFKDKADCIKNSKAIFDGILNAKRGCSIVSNFGYGKYYDLNINMHPYSFDLSGLNAKVNPNARSNYMYINDLNQTKQLIQNGDVMAINVNGKIIAKGKNGTILSNYTNNCSANNLNIALNYDTYKKDTNITTIKDNLGNIITPQYSLFVQSIDTSANVDNGIPNKISINYPKRYFEDNNSTAGQATFNAYINYKRDFNAPVNPFNIHFSIFDLNSTLDKSAVDLSMNHIPHNSKDLNSTKIVYYAKAKSLSDFYDDIDSSQVTTPIMITIFCNESLKYCEDYNINTAKMITSEYDWWISKNHSSIGKEGNVDLTTNDTSKAVVYPTLINTFINGVNRNVAVQDVGITNRPYTVEVKPTLNMLNNYSWLLFNKYKNQAPAYLYRVKFVDAPSAWSGKGQTGHTNNVKASGRKSKKVDW